MALETTLSALVQDVYLPMMPQFISNQNPVIEKLWKGGRNMQGGERIRQAILYDYQTGEWYTRFSQFTIAGQEIATTAFFDWRFFMMPLVVDGTDVLRISGPEAFKPIVETTIKAARIAAVKAMTTALYGSGTDSTLEPNSLDHLLDDTSGTLSGSATCGTIDKGTYTWWGGNAVDGSGANMSQTLLTTGMIPATDGNIMPDIILMCPKGFYNWLDDLHSLKRFTGVTAQAGFTTAQFYGATVIADKNIADGADAANRVYMLNSEFIEIVSHSKDNMVMKPFQEPWDQRTLVGKIYWTGGFTVQRPSYHSVLYNFDNAAA